MEEQKSRSIMRSIINFLQGIAFTLLILAITLAIYFIILYRTRLTPYVNYAIVFDAGSSHTEMFVYNWPADKSDGLGTTSIVNQFFTCELKGVILNGTTKPKETKLKAISDFHQNLDLLNGYFQPCLNEAISKIPKNRHKFSPIFLGATAGMRLVRLHNHTNSQQILETIREIFSNTPFQFVVARQVRILTGIEEAIDGWITTNILLEKFKHRHAKKKENISKSIQAKQTFDTDMVGVLDLGGASTQVTFTYTDTVNHEKVPDEFTSNISLFDTVYNPYAHSYLCWGKNEALKRHRVRLLNSVINNNRTLFPKPTQIRVGDPCLARGTNDTLSLIDVFLSPCTANEKQKSDNYFNISSVVFFGQGNAVGCNQSLTNLLKAKRMDTTAKCSYKPEYCTFDHTYQPKIPEKVHFIGLSGYFYVFNNLAYGMSDHIQSSKERYQLKDFSIEKIRQRLINVCDTHYSKLYTQEGMHLDPKAEQHKRGLCFDAWYVWLLLTYAIGFSTETLKRLTVVFEFPTGKVGWTLGYMINQTNYIPAEFRERALKKNVYYSSLTSSCIIGLIASIFLLVTCYIYCKPKSTSMSNNKNKYLRSNEQELA